MIHNEEILQERLIKVAPHHFLVTIVSQTKTMVFEVTHPVDIAEFRTRFLMIFKKEFNEQENKLIVNETNVNDSKIRTAAAEFVSRYRDELHIVNKLNDYFKVLREGEGFIIYPNQRLSKLDSHKVLKYLYAMETNQDFETLWQATLDKFGTLLEVYDFSVYDSTTKKSIGQIDKKKRVCRFCNNTRQPLAFKNVSHAISESLGNKRIFINEECDGCNSFFGNGIERDLFEYVRIYLSVTGIEGKSGVSNIKGKNFTFYSGPKPLLEVTINKSPDITSDEALRNLTLETKEEVSPQNIYRTLCKFALSVIDEEHVPHFNNTAEWISGKITAEVLPHVAIRIDPQESFSHPSIVVYTRGTETDGLPYLVAELRVSVLRFVYVVPTFATNEPDMLSQEKYDEYWRIFKNYSSVEGWSFVDFSDDVKKQLIYKVDFERQEGGKLE